MVCEERDVSRESELGQHGGSIRGGRGSGRGLPILAI